MLELKDKFKLVDNFITGENVSSHFKYEFIPKKMESHLTKFIVYELETYNIDRACLHAFWFYRLSKLAGNYDKEEITPYELEKCRNESIVFAGDNCMTKALDFSLKLKGEEGKFEKKIVECKLQSHAHNGSSFDSWIVLNNLPCDKHVVNTIKRALGINELKVFNGYIQRKKKQISQILQF